MHARLDCKYGGNGVILCSIPSGKSTVALNGGVVVSKSDIQCSDRGLFLGSGDYELPFQF